LVIVLLRCRERECADSYAHALGNSDCDPYANGYTTYGDTCVALCDLDTYTNAHTATTVAVFFRVSICMMHKDTSDAN
jgi:hypothetical protein